MPIDAFPGRRPPFTFTKGITYIVALAALGATIALPVVLMLAHKNLEGEKARMVAAEAEIDRLTSQYRQSIARENELREQYTTAVAAHGPRGENRAQPAAETNLQPHDDALKTSKQQAKPLAGRGQALTQASPHQSETGPADFETKLARLHQRVVGGETAQHPLEDFDSRLSRLHEKVMRSAGK